ncbi:MAG: hypothetical protein GY787_27960 [Alteromonadales bacterium]|nr:hypothetical protein [Alteromonadales bacterium]
MKVIYILFLLSASIKTIKKSCKTEIPRAFGLHGLLSPNRVNPLCPDISWNCCTNHDMMKVYKIWHEETEIDLHAQYEMSLKYFNKFNSDFIALKNMIFMPIIVTRLGEAYPNGISKDLTDHLNDIAGKFNLLPAEKLKIKKESV